MKSHCPRLTRPGHVSRAAMADDDHCCSARTPRRPLCSPTGRSHLSSQRGQRSARASADMLAPAAAVQQQSRQGGRGRSRAAARLGWPSLPRSHAHTPANAPCSSPASLSWNACSQSRRGNMPSRKDPFPTLCPSSPPTCTNPVAPSLPWSQRPSCVTLIPLPHHQQTSTAGPTLFSPPLIVSLVTLRSPAMLLAAHLLLRVRCLRH